MADKTEIVYIIGPMRGRRYYNAPAFDAARYELIQAGHAVISPVEQDRHAGLDVYALPETTDWAQYPPGFDLSACWKRCINAVMACDAIYRLPGWEQSVGARAESALAEWMGKAIMDAARTCKTCEHMGHVFCTAPKTKVDTKEERAEGEVCGPDGKLWRPKAAAQAPAPQEPPPATETILSEAARLTSADRQRQYGHPREHFARTAAALTARFSTGTDPLFRRVMDPQEWPLMMALDKLAGRGQDTRAIKRDSLVDVAGYCRTIEMCGEPGNTEVGRDE